MALGQGACVTGVPGLLPLLDECLDLLSGHMVVLEHPSVYHYREISV
jgi:hypothetical protein